MQNKELLNICYKFFNRFITADELIKKISNIDKTNLKKSEIEEVNKLLNEIKKISNDRPIVEDEYVIQKKKTIKNLINRLESIPKNENNEEYLNRELINLKNDYSKQIDSYERWFAITDYINKNDYFNRNFENLSDYELLEFIAQNIQAPFPPQLTQEEFEKLVKVGIENDKREWLWRLAFNYERKNINFDSIMDYFIKMKDGYYLVELISILGEYLNIDKMIEEINDKDLIEYLMTNKNVIKKYVTEKQFNRLINKL